MSEISATYITRWPFTTSPGIEIVYEKPCPKYAARAISMDVGHFFWLNAIDRHTETLENAGGDFPPIART